MHLQHGDTSDILFQAPSDTCGVGRDEKCALHMRWLHFTGADLGSDVSPSSTCDGGGRVG